MVGKQSTHMSVITQVQLLCIASMLSLARLIIFFGACAVGLGWQRSTRRMPSGYLADSDSQDLGNLKAGPSVDSTAATVATSRCASVPVLSVGP